MNPNSVPTGNTSEVVHQYYDYLYSYFLGRIQQNFFIHADTLLWVLLWILVVSAGFYAFTRWQRRTHVPKEPYPVESYNGYIQESNGPVGIFLILFFSGMFVWLLIMTILNLLNGQIY